MIVCLVVGELICGETVKCLGVEELWQPRVDLRIRPSMRAS
jgi:hypothetical protein